MPVIDLDTLYSMKADPGEKPLCQFWVLHQTEKKTEEHATVRAPNRFSESADDFDTTLM